MAEQEYFQQDRGKLIEATLYLCELSLDDPYFGVGKLAKLLYYADSDAYIHHGQPITGTTYLHFPHGPYPENWHQVREEMEQNGDAEVSYELSNGGYHRYRLLPLRSADLERLEPSDLEILEAQVSRFAGVNAAGIEHYSHQEVAWLSTEDGQPMAYELAGVISASLTTRDVQQARSLK